MTEKTTALGQHYMISIHIPLMRYDLCDWCDYQRYCISIHIPLMRYDVEVVDIFIKIKISIHIPLMRYDTRHRGRLTSLVVFQSTYRSRGMTSVDR